MIRVKKEVEAGFGATIANRVADQLRDDIVSQQDHGKRDRGQIRREQYAGPGGVQYAVR